MKPYCEIVSQDVIPALRALLAKELMDKYKMTQGKVAEKLGVSQAAVSQYYRSVRGSKTNFLQNDKEITQFIKKVAGRIASGELNYISALEEFCMACKLIRKKKLICEMHKRSSPNLKECNLGLILLQAGLISLQNVLLTLENDHAI